MATMEDIRFLVVQENDHGQVIQQAPHPEQIGQCLPIRDVEQDDGDTPPGLSEPGGEAIQRSVQFQSQFRMRFLQPRQHISKSLTLRLTVTDNIHGSPSAS